MNYTEAVTKYGSINKAAAALDIPRATFQRHYHREVSRAGLSLTEATGRRRFIVTSYINGTDIHTDFFKNLKTYAKSINAELVIGEIKPYSKTPFATPENIDKHVVTSPVTVNGMIRFCPELNLKPTITRPLEGLQTYTKSQWGVFFHPKVQLECVPTQKTRPTKFNLTTGTISLPEYGPNKAGYRAHFDHVISALLVETDGAGVWFRHLTPKDDTDGSFYDLTTYVRGQSVSAAKHRPLAIVYGDIHVEDLDDSCGLTTWGFHNKTPTLIVDREVAKRSLAAVLNPHNQIVHDVVSLNAVNHHEAHNTFSLYKRFIRGELDLTGDLGNAIRFLNHIQEFSDNTYVIPSNHDEFIVKAILSSNLDQTCELKNLLDLARIKVALLENIESERNEPILECLFRRFLNSSIFLSKVKFLRYDDELPLMGIECGWHGHHGPNGSKGSKHAFKKVTEKAVTGHSHTPAIESGSYVVGTSSRLDLGYNLGPSSWAHTHCVIYKDGNRTLLNMSNGKFYMD
jgi:hypothetical protein